MASAHNTAPYPAEHSGFETVIECCRYCFPAWRAGVPTLPLNQRHCECRPQQNECDIIPLIPLHCRVYQHQFSSLGIDHPRCVCNLHRLGVAASVRPKLPVLLCAPCGETPTRGTKTPEGPHQPCFDFGSACFSCILAFTDSGMNLPSSPCTLVFIEDANTWSSPAINAS